MKRCSLVAAAAAALFLMAAPWASASSPNTAGQHDRDVIRFFVHHPKLAQTPAGQRELWKVLGHVTAQLRSLQSARVVTPTNDWVTAVGIVQRFYPGSAAWLLSCSGSEGGHGVWKFRNDVGALTPRLLLNPPDVPGGQMQYFQSTFWTDFNGAVQDLTSRHVRVPREAFSWFSTLGQALAGGWAYSHARPSGKWTGSGC